MSQILNKPINSIQPDPNQPRKRFNQKDLEDLAKGIKSEGVINPIEIDSDDVIITGERRWRASKLAGLVNVPCFLGREMDEAERFKHQLAENIHHNTMSDIDTAKAFRRVLDDYEHIYKKIAAERVGGSGWNSKGVTWLSREMGKSRTYIGKRLALLNQSKELQDAVDEGKIRSNIVESVIRTRDQRMKKKLEVKILKGEIKHKEIAEALIKATEYHPDRAEDLMDLDFSEDTERVAMKKIEAVAPVTTADKEKFFNGTELINTADKLCNLLDDCPIDKVSGHNKPFLVLVVSRLRKKLINYMNNQPQDEVL